MLLRLSRFVHFVPVGSDRILIIDAISHVRQAVTNEFAVFIKGFATPREVQTVQQGSLLAGLIERGILTERDCETELAHVSGLLSPFYGRDPAALLQHFRRKAMTGGDPYWTATVAFKAEDFQITGPRVDLIMFGDCDVHMECDFLRRAGADYGIDLRVAATFPDDLRLTTEHKHDAIIIGALEARHSIILESTEGEEPHACFLAAAETMLINLRKLSQAPILIDNLPEPTLQPMGLAERGSKGHRNRFRAANLALADLAERYTDVHIVDIAAALNASGSERMVDDGYFGFTHFGSPGWLLQRSPKETSAVYGVFPEMSLLANKVGGDPYIRETITAQAHSAALITTLGLNKKKCVIVDLDGILWPSVLAETGAPFAWSPELSSPYSYVGLFFGIHEALLTLKRRGILLASVSKNDESLIRRLWVYENHYPRDALLTPDDFVTWRVNWNDKVDNIKAIIAELGLAPESFLFIDDSPIERERIRQRLSEIEVWGEDILALRRRLLTDPRLQAPRFGVESSQRTERTKAQLQRQAAQAQSKSEDEFLATLDLHINIAAANSNADFGRVSELFERTTQFNTTGRKFSPSTLTEMSSCPEVSIFIAHVRDRFTDHGLVGAAIVEEGEIIGFALSCRVLGLGVEHGIISYIIENVSLKDAHLRARIIATERNMPVRNLYRDNGFSEVGDGLWLHLRPQH